MTGIAANVAYIKDGKILLTKWDDSVTWILPSGGVEEGESIAQAVGRIVNTCQRRNRWAS